MSFASKVLNRVRPRAIRCASWAEAVERSQGYESDLLCRFRIARGAHHAEPCPSELTGEAGHIVDFGGGAGERARGLHGRVTVVETAAMVALARPSDRVAFSRDLPTSFDVFYSNAALQYVEDPYSVLIDAFARATRKVVLVRNTFSEVDRFHVQRCRLFENGSGPIPSGFRDTWVSYPHRTLKESVVRQIAYGWRCRALRESDHLSGYGKGLVFERHATPTAVM